MRSTTRATVCPACGRREPTDARWCGDCGAALAPRPVLVVASADATAAPTTAPPVRRGARTWAVVGLVLLAALLVPRAPTDPVLLGRLDDATGRSSSQSPPSGLQLLWRRTVDPLGGVPDEPVGPPVLVHLGGPRYLVGDRVVDVEEGRTTARLPGTGGRVAADGMLAAADGDDLVLLDLDGTVRARRPVAGTWRPRGAALGWVAGAAVLTDGDGVLGAVDRDGRVRWTADPSWRWDGTGHGADHLVVERPVDGEAVRTVVDGRTGALVTDLGPSAEVHAPVVHGAWVLHVDLADVRETSLGHPVRVVATSLDGGAGWRAENLPPTSGPPTDIVLTRVPDGVVVHYATVGRATTAVWLDPDGGTRAGFAALVGSGRTAAGWPVADVLDEAVVHVQPVREEVRVVSRRGSILWSAPAARDEGVVGDGAVVLVHTPPRPVGSAGRLRIVDGATGEVRWTDRDGAPSRLVGVLGGSVGLATSAAPGPRPLHEQDWFDVASGRRRDATRLAATVLGRDPSDTGELTLLGSVRRGDEVVPLFLGHHDGGRTRLVGPAGADAAELADGLLGDTGPVAASTGIVGDAELDVTVGTASVTARGPRGDVRWRRELDVALRPDAAVLLPGHVVVLDARGRLHALDRADGGTSWRSLEAVSALTGAGSTVVAGTRAGEVVVLGADGAVVERVAASSAAVDDVAVLGDTVVVVAGDEVVGLGRGVAVVEPADRVELP